MVPGRLGQSGEPTSFRRHCASTSTGFPDETLLAYEEQLQEKLKWVRDVLSEHVLELQEQVWVGANSTFVSCGV